MDTNKSAENTVTNTTRRMDTVGITNFREKGIRPHFVHVKRALWNNVAQAWERFRFLASPHKRSVVILQIRDSNRTLPHSVRDPPSAANSTGRAELSAAHDRSL